MRPPVNSFPSLSKFFWWKNYTLQSQCFKKVIAVVFIYSSVIEITTCISSLISIFVFITQRKNINRLFKHILFLVIIRLLFFIRHFYGSNFFSLIKQPTQSVVQIFRFIQGFMIISNKSNFLLSAG